MPRVQKKQSKVYLPICSNAYDDVSDFEVCRYHKNLKPKYLENETLFFLQIKKSIHYILRANNLWQRTVF